ncbi:AAA family ATPase [Leucobacter allii]|uniref:AAA family ATPase n=1 Tax=Leucobacter allii TaxID=2932247 RepID=UPI001FD30214|nr:AAA family ATPase [Leucobacter allii]UOR02015.1 AAA family ATPase [Leucobacter allii]
MHIVGLTVENFQRVKAVSIEPDSSGAVIISGKNAQGKSSLLNAIWAAIGGREGNKAVKPIREGADEARVTVDLGDMTVTRIWRNGTTAVKVQSKDGAEYKSPQTLLDSFIGKLSFDPLAFTRLKDREQKEALLQLVKLDIDLDELQRLRESAFAERTTIGQERKRLGDVEVDENLPEAEESAAEIIGEIRAAHEYAAEFRRLEDGVDSWSSAVGRLKAQMKSLKLELESAEARLAGAKADLAVATAPASTDLLEARLASVEETNAAIRENNGRRATLNAAAELDAKYATLTREIANLDEVKSDALARAEFPVAGLGFDADGVTFNGVPFAQASSAEQIRVSLAMAMSSNPKLRVIRIMDGSLLDSDGMRIITESAREHDFQVWIERVADADGIGFVIEDGELLEEPADAVA